MRALALTAVALVTGPARAALPPLDPEVAPAFHAAAKGPARVTLAGPVDVPVEPGRLPNVLVRVNGEGPFRFGIETGSPVVVVTPSLAAKLALPQAGGDERMRAHAIARLELGGAVFEGVVAAAVDVAAPDIDGVLGLALFQDVLLTVDGPARQVRLERGALAADGPGVVAVQRLGPFVGVPARFAGSEEVAIVDTRAMSDLLVLPDLAKELPFVSPPVEVGRARGPSIPETATSAARLDGDVTFAGVRVVRPILSIHPVPPPIPQRPVIGNGVLSRLAFTLDQRTERIRFTAPGPLPAPPPIRTLGFGLRGRPGAPLEAGPIAAGSAAEKAGVRQGDVVVGVAGVPAAQLDPARIRELLQGKGKVAVKLSRDGVEREVTLEPVTLVP